MEDFAPSSTASLFEINTLASAAQLKSTPKSNLWKTLRKK
jgi:hypothetical protein